MTMNKATKRWTSTFKMREEMIVKDEYYNMMEEHYSRLDKYPIPGTSSENKGDSIRAQYCSKHTRITQRPMARRILGLGLYAGPGSSPALTR